MSKKPTKYDARCHEMALSTTVTERRRRTELPTPSPSTAKPQSAGDLKSSEEQSRKVCVSHPSAWRCLEHIPSSAWSLEPPGASLSCAQRLLAAQWQDAEHFLLSLA